MSPPMTSPSTAAPEMDAIDPRLVVVTPEPFNAEAPLAEQIGLLTRTPLHYVRTHFGIPRLRAQDWRLALDGEVERPYQVTYDELRALPSRSLRVTLECAGNGRSGLHPPAQGEPWQYGAVSTAEWTGVPLATLLEAGGLTSWAREILIEGADRGTVATRAGPIPFARSLPLEVARHPDTLLAYAMNGQPLTAPHGFPARLIVPGWYGMAAVKWVTRIAALAAPFEGYHQTERYIMDYPERGKTTSASLTTMRVRSLIIAPAALKVASLGELRDWHRQIKERGLPVKFAFNHGASLAFYFDDPEGHMIEIYWATPVRVRQPVLEAIDLDAPEEELRRDVERVGGQFGLPAPPPLV